jgi:hypothetical protein
MEPDKEREPYEPPEVVKVKLVRDELAVVGCKTRGAVTGPVVGCVRGLAGGCRSAGS